MARGSSGGNRLWLWLAIAAIIVVLDQFTKTLILSDFAYGDSRPVTAFFNVVRVHNTGAAFSFLAGGSGWQRWFFVALAIGVSGFIVWMLRSQGHQKLFAWALTLILGGAVGNAWDRFADGHVVDYLHFHWGEHYFPAFNVADIGITTGAIMLIVDALLHSHRSKAAQT